MKRRLSWRRVAVSLLAPWVLMAGMAAEAQVAPAQSGVRAATNGQLANGTAQDVLQAMVRNAAQNPVSGAIVTFAATPGVAFNGGAVGASGTCTTNATGLCQVTATSTVAGVKSTAVSTAAGVLTGAFTAGGNTYQASPIAYGFGPPPTIAIRKQTVNATGTNTFGFTLTNVTGLTDSVTVTGVATVASGVVHTGTPGTAVTIQESTVPAWWPGNPTSVLCIDANAAVSGNAVSNLATRSGNTATLRAANVRANAVITCTFVNTAGPVLALTKTAPATVVPGGTMTYGLSLNNSGLGATGTTVLIPEQLPTGVVLTAVTPGPGAGSVSCGTLPSAPGAGFECTMTLPPGGIGPGATVGFTLTTTAPAIAAGAVLINYATAATSGFGTVDQVTAQCVPSADASCANASTTVVTGAAAVAQSGVRTVTDNQLADGTAQDVLEAMVRDAGGNPVAGAVVTFAATADVAFNGGAIGAAGTCTTDAAGRCQVTSTSTVAGAKSSAASIAAGVMTGAFTAGGNAYHASPATYNFVGLPRVVVRKTTTNGAGPNTFGFTLTGVTNLTDSIAVAGAATVVSAVVHDGTVGTAATIAESSVPTGWPATPVSAICLDANAPADGNVTTNLATTVGSTATLAGGVMKAGALITCTFTNTAAPIVSLSKTAPATATPGAAMSYGLTAANIGAIATGTTVVVREQLPPGVVATAVTPGTGVTAVACGAFPSAAGAALTCTMTLPAGGIPAAASRSFTLAATAPSTAALAATGTVLTNYANTNVSGSGTPATAPGAACVSNATVSCASAATTIVAGAGVVAQSGVRTVTDNQLADGMAQDVLEAMVRDVAQNPVSGAVVTFAATATVAFNGGTVGAAGTCTTDASGRCQVTTTSTVAGAKSSATSIAAGVMTGAFTAGGNAYHASPVTYNFVALPRIVVRKTTTNGAGANTFGFTLTGVTNPTDSIVVTGVANVASAVIHNGTVGTAATVVESSVPTGWPATPVSAVCLDANAPADGNVTTNLATTAGSTATLAGSVMKAGALITCTFTNTAAPIITLSKTAPTTVAPGASMSYGLSAANTGPIATGTTVVVREQLPPGVVATAVAPGAGVTSVACGALPSAAGAALTCTMTLPAGGIPVAAARGFTLTATAPSTAALASTGTVLTNYANTNVSGSGTPATAPGASCVSSATVSCASAATTIVTGAGAIAQSGVRTVTDNQLADGTAQDVLEAMVRDAAQNPVSGAVVTFAATTTVAFNGGVVGAAGSCTTDASGLCQVTATSTVAGAKSSATSIAAGVMTGAFISGGNTYHASPVTYTFVALPRIIVRKTTTTGVGANTFGFTLTGVTNSTDSIAVTGAATAASAVVHNGTAGTAATVGETGVPTGWPATPASISCLDANAPGNGNATTNLATTVGETASLAGSVMRPGALITCTFTNTAAPIVSLSKTAPATAVPGAAMSYGLTAANIGAIATGTTVVVREQLPPGVVATAVTPGTGVTAVACGAFPSAAGAALTCTMTLPAGGIPAAASRSFTLAATAPSTAALAAAGTVLTNYANTNVSGSGTPATAPGAACVSSATVSCASAATTIVAGAGAVAQSGVRTVTDNQLADGTAQDVLEAMVRDVAQNPVSGAVVTFAATASVAFNGAAVGAVGTCTTNSAGLCQVTATSTLVGAKSSAASIAAGVMTGAFTSGGNAFHASPVTYSFVLGAASGAQSGLRVVDDNRLANGVAQDLLEVYIRDAGGNPVGAGTVVGFGATPNVAFNGGAVGAGASCTTTAASTCQVTATSTVAAIYSTTPVTVGGVALAGSFTAGGNSYLPSPQPYRFGAMPTVTIRKISLNAIGTFDFTGSNGLQAQSITTSVSGTPASALTQTLSAAGVVTTITEAIPPAGFSLTSASCTGLGAGGTATLSGNTLTLNAAATAPGSNAVCTFTNTGSTVVVPPIPPTIMCTTNPAVFNTAYGPTGPLTSGRDTVWESGEGTATGGPGSVASWQRSYVGNQAPGAWINSPFGTANWISNYTTAGQGANNVDVYHRFTFSLAPSVTPSSFSLKLDFYSDNSVAEVFVNGVLQTVPSVPQGGPNPYVHVGFVAGAAATATLANNWQSGTNSVVFHIKSGPGAEGFLAQSTATTVCAPPTVTLSKTTTGSAGGPFGFLLTNTAQASGSATTTVAGTPVQVDGNTATAGLQAFSGTAVGTAVTIDEAAVPGWNLASAICTDAGAPVGSLGTGAAARTYTIPAASVQYGKALQCLFTNSASATVTVRKVSIGNVGSFGFTGDNGLAAQSIVTATAGTAVAAGIQTLATPATVTTLTEDPLPANYALTAVACSGLGAGGSATPDLPNRKVVLDAAATAAGSNIVCTFTNTYTPPYPKVQIVKTTVGGTGSNVFGFALSGLSAPTDTITVVGAGTASGSATLVGTAGLEASMKETVPTGWPANPVSASCVDTASATPTAAFGTLVANQLTIPAANMLAGAAITCTFTNSFGFSVGGRVFNDNGVGAGTANDGIPNGGEAGIAGVTVRLTNCAATVLASAVTDGAGRYTLAVPFATAPAATLCVEETNPATPSAWTSTGASVGGTALPSGTATTVAGTAYTYTRTGTPDRIAFAWNGSAPASLDFGDVAPNTFAADGAKTGLPGSTVSYPHTFKAQTGGVVRFGIPSEVATPTLAGWSGKIFADTACTGALQAGAVLLYPPSVPVTVVAGQSVCLVMQEFIPATAMSGHSNNATVQASFDFSNASPALGASYTVHDITTVSDSVLELKKEVRNVTQGGAFGINNQAKSGETLEYRITYTNNGVSPIGTLSVNDTTPSYTSFVGAQTGSTPATLTACQKTTPANPAPGPTVACAAAQAGGGTGALSWHFTGMLTPGASGAVTFTVKVD
ncbi:prealbumin-like fold domain-containing protein [Variovorax sp. LT2P21]|uniref:prealbumin-like fold domain-containing protein n=1 Tax=Variovorax sp. LT2P21 TaxID=3443731 RepID=UPI003F44BC1E